MLTFEEWYDKYESDLYIIWMENGMNYDGHTQWEEEDWVYRQYEEYLSEKG